MSKKRLRLSQNTEAAKKSQLGQFSTPEKIATFMASLFPNAGGKCILLDAGAGIGSLSAAFLDRWQSGGFGFDQVAVDAIEIDASLHHDLLQTLQKYQTQTNGA